MFNRKEIKKKGRKSFYQNIWKCITICFLVTILTGELAVQFVSDVKPQPKQTIDYAISNLRFKSNASIINEFLKDGYQSEISIVLPKASAGVLAGVVNNISKSGSFLFGVLNAINQMVFNNKIVAGVLISIGALLAFLYWVFVCSVLKVGECRFFLENRVYKKTKTNRLFVPYKVKKVWNVSMVMLLKNVYMALWSLTIVGGYIKYYSYRMVPYLLAENPTLKPKEAIFLSRQMMKGYKWKLFVLDLSMIHYTILGILTFNVSNLFYTNPYRAAIYAEVYMNGRERMLQEGKEVYAFDLLLEGGEELSVDTYPTASYPLKEASNRKWMQIESPSKYSLNHLILLFFSACIIGWIWECLLMLFQDGILVNRGTLLGPWLPIYGSGAALVLILLNRFRKKPILTFVLTMLVCGTIEYGTACYLEIVHGMNWWDYTGYLFNIGGKVCLEALLVFGLGGCAFIYVGAPYLNRWFEKWDKKIKNVLCVLLIVLMILDFWYSSKNPNVGHGVSSEMSGIEEKVYQNT